MVVGRTQSGKTLSTRREVAREPRLLVWDIEGVWAEQRGITRLTKRAELFNGIQKVAAGSGRFAYVSAAREEFDFWAECAYWWGRMGAEQGVRTVVVAEEIAFTTSPGKAPPGWHRLLAQGLKWGVDIWALTQRPAESDKTCLGNATRIRCFDCSRAEDRRYMERQMDLDTGRIAGLKTLEYIERDMITKGLRQARLAV